ncbi:MAG: endonuclease [Alphaproteobacteria bacterium]|nr:endonuclease [Alphaproteobacteria bacterium]MCB9930597.1 endonuclease [Alphaproteobacteria bacterium]
MPVFLLAFALALLALTGATSVMAQVLTVVSFNVESDDDTQPARVAEDIAAISKAGAVDLFGLAEVQNAADLNVYARAASRPGAAFKPILARNGNEDRVAILYNAATLALDDVRELDRFPGSRKALVAQFAYRAKRLDFLFIVNHFNRGDAERRNRQARLIRDWVLAQDRPAILVGDYNFDYDPRKRRGNEAFEIFTADPGLVWLPVPCIAKGRCPATGTQCDRRFNSIMDFVFVADRGRGWRGRSAILMQQNGYCERERRGYSDHRPVAARILLR